MPALKINRYLAAGGDFQPIMEKARELDALSKLLDGFLPPELAPLARVSNFKEGKLVIHAANGPAAAKLKLLSESLGIYISKQRSQVNSVSVRVQPAAARAADAAPQHLGAVRPHQQARATPEQAGSQIGGARSELPQGRKAQGAEISH